MVVKVNIFIDEFLCLFKGGIFEVTQVFFLEMTKEILHGSIVPTISSARHGGSNAILLSKDIMIRLRSVLVPLVTVEDKSISDLFLLHGLVYGMSDQTNRILFGEVTGNDKAIEEILDCREIAPALLGHDIGNIGDPLLVGAGCHKISLEYIGVGVVCSEFFQLSICFSSSGSGLDTEFFHQAEYRFRIYHPSLPLSQPESNATIPIDSMTGLIGFLNLLHPCPIPVYLIQLPQPFIIGCSRNTKELTHGFHRIFCSMVVDRPILRCASCSSRNSVWNFFSNTTSISSLAI